MEKPSINNFVAKYSKKYNKAAVMKDRKKALKRGQVKHKSKMYEDKDMSDLIAVYNEARLNGNVQLASETLEVIDQLVQLEAKQDINKLGFRSLKKNYLSK